MWTGKKPNNSHLRIFGCSAYGHIRQDKLQAKTKKCVLLGYPEGTKGYRLWCIEPGEEGCIISRDVVFNETRMPLLEKKSEATEKDPLNSPNIELKVEFDLSQTDTDGDSEPEENENSETQKESTNDYQPLRERQKRTIKPPTRLGYADIIAYALKIVEEPDTSEPGTYREAIS